MTGKIYLNKEFVKWPFFNDARMVKMFIYILLNADEGGIFETSLTKLANVAGMSKQELRTALNKLEKNGQITRSATQQATHVKCTNIESYRDKQHSQQHTDQHTTEKNLKEIEKNGQITRSATQQATHLNNDITTNYSNHQHTEQHTEQHTTDPNSAKNEHLTHEATQPTATASNSCSDEQHTEKHTQENTSLEKTTVTHLLNNVSNTYEEEQHTAAGGSEKSPFIYIYNNNINNKKNNVNNNNIELNKKSEISNFSKNEKSENAVFSLFPEMEKEKENTTREMIDARHAAPTLAEINDYIEKKGFTNVIGVQFFSHYKATGWKTTGGAKIINWRAKVDSWEYSDINKKQATNGQQNTTSEPRRDVKPEEF